MRPSTVLRPLVIRGALAVVCAAVLLAARATAAQAPHARGEQVELFSRAGCPHCAEAEAFLNGLQRSRPELRLVVREHDVSADPAALERLRTLASQAGYAQVGVPALYVRGRLFVGFDSERTTGAAIEAWLDAPRAGKPPAEGPACAAEGAAACAEPGTTPRNSVRLPWFGVIDVRDIGLPLFTIAIALVDGFNPCAMWVLLFVLSMLVNLKSRARMALVGGTFVVVSGLVYFAFMAAWLNFFVVVGISRAIQVTLGLVAVAVGGLHVKDFFAFGTGPSLSIPATAKPGIYRRVRQVIYAENMRGALAAVAVLALLVNTVELLCTAGLPAVYTQVLTSQGLGSTGHYAYLALYNLVYMLDDTAMLAVAVFTLSRKKLQERGGRALKLLSGVVMAALGLLLLFRPEWLTFG